MGRLDLAETLGEGRVYRAGRASGQGKGRGNVEFPAHERQWGPCQCGAHTKRIRELAERSRGRLVVVDEKSAYFRLRPTELEPLAMYRAIQGLLRA